MAINSARGPAWDKLRLFVLDRDSWLCTSCGKPLEGADATVDHISAINSGGDTLPRSSELCSLCRSCNSRKGDRVLMRLNYLNPRWLARSTA